MKGTKGFVCSAFLMVGCGTLDQQYASAIKQSADLILPDYVQYVESDPNLDDDSKKLRKDNVRELEALLEEGVSGE